MTHPVARLRQALAMPLPVLARKLGQRGRALAHRAVASPGSAWTRDGVGPDVFRSITRNGPSRFFFSAADRAGLIGAFQAREPAAEAATLQEADGICAHRFDLLGSGPVQLGKRIDWHRDFKSGLRWDLKHHTAIDMLDLQRPSDVKVVWELSRCHHWVRLGQAYWFTGSGRYVEEFLSQWESWMQENPPGFGVNWTCAMEAGIRAVNWLWTFFLFGEAQAFDADRQRRLLGALADHGRFILHNLEIGALPGNHYLTDGVALLTLGLVLPELPGSPQWLETGSRILWGELDRQVTPDGVDYEHAVGYHGYVLQCLLFALSLCRMNGQHVPPAATARIQRMLEFTLVYTRPDGSLPNFGDGDDGQLIDLGERLAGDHRPLLAAGAALFGRADFKEASRRFGAANLWWLGLRGLEAYEAIGGAGAQVISRAFPQGGFFVMRGRDRHLVVSGSGAGPASHMHHDLLSFECWADGMTYVVDPGTYLYTGSSRWRNHFRSTASHNTVTVDGQEQTRLLDDPNLFPINRDEAARFTLRGWQAAEYLDSFDGEHTGYRRLVQPVTHRRQIWFEKPDGFWVIRDLLTGTGAHRIAGYLHFAPMEVTIESNDPWIVSAGSPDRRLVIAWVPSPGLSLSLTDGWYSPRYGAREKAPVVSYEMQRGLPVDITFALVPNRAGAALDIEAVLQRAADLR